MSDNKGFFESLKPKSAFWFGAIFGFGIMFMIGFFVMVGIFLTNGNDGEVAGTTTNTNSAAAPTPTPSVPQPTEQADIRVEPVTDKDWVKGSRDAKVSIIEFSDTECPFCKRHHPTLQKIVDDYQDQVNWVYRHFPLVSLHSKAPKEAEATECAGEQGGNDGFWKYIDRLFEITPGNDGLDLSQLPQIAKDVGLNVSKFNECLDSGKYAEKVQDQVRQAAAAGGRGTPHNVIVSGDQVIPIAGAVPYEQLKSTIDSLL